MLFRSPNNRGVDFILVRIDNFETTGLVRCDRVPQVAVFLLKDF